MLSLACDSAPRVRILGMAKLLLNRWITKKSARTMTRPPIVRHLIVLSIISGPSGTSCSESRRGDSVPRKIIVDDEAHGVSRNRPCDGQCKKPLSISVIQRSLLMKVGRYANATIAGNCHSTFAGPSVTMKFVKYCKRSHRNAATCITGFSSAESMK